MLTTGQDRCYCHDAKLFGEGSGDCSQISLNVLIQSLKFKSPIYKVIVNLF